MYPIARFRCLLAALLLTFSLNSDRGMKPSACKSSGVANLKELVLQSQVPRLSLLVLDQHTGDGSSENWATSTLKAEGKPPVTKGMHEFAAEGAYNDWSCMFAPRAIHDGKIQTAWSEGVEGSGVGQIVLFPAAYFEKGSIKSAKLKIFNGFGKSRSLWQKNNRVKKLTLHLMTARKDGMSAFWEHFTGMKYVCSQEIGLQDTFGFQNVAVPLASCNWSVPADTNADGEGSPAFVVALEIQEVYKGQKYDDTLISEASFQK